jgi:hypothetical protein
VSTKPPTVLVVAAAALPEAAAVMADTAEDIVEDKVVRLSQINSHL